MKKLSKKLFNYLALLLLSASMTIHVIAVPNYSIPISWGRLNYLFVPNGDCQGPGKYEFSQKCGADRTCCARECINHPDCMFIEHRGNECNGRTECDEYGDREANDWEVHRKTRLQDTPYTPIAPEPDCRTHSDCYSKGLNYCENNKCYRCAYSEQTDPIHCGLGGGLSGVCINNRSQCVPCYGNNTSGCPSAPVGWANACSGTTCTQYQISYCGDGAIDAGEVCDDGNTVSGDGCSSDCKLADPCQNPQVTCDNIAMCTPSSYTQLSCSLEIGEGAQGCHQTSAYHCADGLTCVGEYCRKNLIKNGNFETQNPSVTITPNGWAADGIANWLPDTNSAASSAVKVVRGFVADINNIHSKNYVVELAGVSSNDASIMQTFTVPETGVYQLNFIYYARLASNNFKVKLDGTVIDDITVTQNKYQSYSKEITLNAGDHTLSFESSGTGGAGPLIDRVGIGFVNNICKDPSVSCDNIAMCAPANSTQANCSMEIGEGAQGCHQTSAYHCADGLTCVGEYCRKNLIKNGNFETQNPLVTITPNSWAPGGIADWLPDTNSAASAAVKVVRGFVAEINNIHSKNYVVELAGISFDDASIKQIFTVPQSGIYQLNFIYYARKDNNVFTVKLDDTLREDITVTQKQYQTYSKNLYLAVGDHTITFEGSGTGGAGPLIDKVAVGILSECSDNNTNNDDGCSSTNTIEPGWTCTGYPSVCKIKTVPCSEGEYVSNNTCVACPAGTTNDAGDDSLGSDTTCDDIDDCANSPCGKDGTCADTGINSYSCSCNSGFSEQPGKTYKDNFKVIKNASNQLQLFVQNKATAVVGNEAIQCIITDNFTFNNYNFGSGAVACFGWSSNNDDCYAQIYLPDGGPAYSYTTANALGNKAQCQSYGPFIFGFSTTDTATTCQPIVLCAANEYVSNNICVACPAGTTNAAGDDASGADTACDDIDECKSGSHNCDKNATCTNVTGSFTCACNAGYTGDGVTCKEALKPCSVAKLNNNSHFEIFKDINNVILLKINGELIMKSTKEITCGTATANTSYNGTSGYFDGLVACYASIENKPGKSNAGFWNSNGSLAYGYHTAYVQDKNSTGYLTDTAALASGLVNKVTVTDKIDNGIDNGNGTCSSLNLIQLDDKNKAVCWGNGLSADVTKNSITECANDCSNFPGCNGIVWNINDNRCGLRDYIANCTENTYEQGKEGWYQYQLSECENDNDCQNSQICDTKYKQCIDNVTLCNNATCGDNAVCTNGNCNCKPGHTLNSNGECKCSGNTISPTNYRNNTNFVIEKDNSNNTVVLKVRGIEIMRSASEITCGEATQISKYDSDAPIDIGTNTNPGIICYARIDNKPNRCNIGAWDASGVVVPGADYYLSYNNDPNNTLDLAVCSAISNALKNKVTVYSTSGSVNTAFYGDAKSFIFSIDTNSKKVILKTTVNGIEKQQLQSSSEITCGEATANTSFSSSSSIFDGMIGCYARVDDASLNGKCNVGFFGKNGALAYGYHTFYNQDNTNTSFLVDCNSIENGLLNKFTMSYSLSNTNSQCVITQ